MCVYKNSVQTKSIEKHCVQETCDAFCILLVLLIVQSCATLKAGYYILKFWQYFSNMKQTYNMGISNHVIYCNFFVLCSMKYLLWEGGLQNPLLSFLQCSYIIFLDTNSLTLFSWVSMIEVLCSLVSKDKMALVRGPGGKGKAPF